MAGHRHRPSSTLSPRPDATQNHRRSAVSVTTRFLQVGQDRAMRFPHCMCIPPEHGHARATYDRFCPPALTTWEIARSCVCLRAPIVWVYAVPITHSTIHTKSTLLKLCSYITLSLMVSLTPPGSGSEGRCRAPLLETGSSPPHIIHTSNSLVFMLFHCYSGEVTKQEGFWMSVP